MNHHFDTMKEGKSVALEPICIVERSESNIQNMRTNFYLSLLTVAFVASADLVFGQGVVNNSAKISISSGTNFIIDNGGFTNQGAGAQVTNAGTMYVDGEWSNTSATNVFGATPTSTTGGLVVLDGAAQDISGTVETHFYNLNVTGSGKKTLDGVDASVYNILGLNFQSIRLNSQTLTLENSAIGPGAISNLGGYVISESAPSTGSYGILRWNMGTNVGNYTIPFGTDAGAPANLAFGYNITTAGSPSSSYKTFATYDTDPQNSFTGTNITTNPLPGQWTDLPFTVNNLTDDYIQAAHYFVTDRFWIIDEENIGEGNGGYAVKPRIEYVFRYLDAENAAPNHITEANLVPQRYNHTEDKWGDWLYGVPAVITNTTSNTVTVQIAQDASTWTEDMYPVWTLVDNSDPLPIEMTRFVGQCANGEIELSWTTWTETNNDFFTVERSNNGVEFEVVDVIEGAGNSNEPLTYNAIDKTPYGGTSYYRLKNTDFSGKSEYSEIIAVSCGTDGNDFNFVNAYDIDQTELMVEFTAAQNEDFTIMLYDAAGKRVVDFGGAAYEGLNKVRLDVADLARGIYIVNLSNAQRNFSKRVMLR